MEKKTIRADNRYLNTKHSVKEMRKQGLVPGVLYGKKIGNVAVSISERDLSKMGGSNLIEVNLAGNSYPAVIREMQKHPVSGEIRHVDFQQVEMDKKIKAMIGIHIIGTPEGVKDGGILQLGERQVEIEALPGEIPDYLEVDVSELRIGDKLTASDIQPKDNLKITAEPESLIALVSSPRNDEEQEATGEEANAPAEEEGEQGPVDGEDSE